MKAKDIFPVQDMLFAGDGDIEISGISYDTRKLQKGDAFFALPGHMTDGKNFIREAAEKGASVIISQEKADNVVLPQIIVKNIFSFMSEFSAKFYNYPDREMTIIGITGTNGKTTITYMIESILAHCGISCGVIGTVNYRYGGKVFNAPNTTPQSADIYKMMREMCSCAIRYLVMEVSSHALALGRVAGIDFDIAVFTNLTRDHLDFHKDIESYFAAKSLLFSELGKGIKSNIKYAIINADDKYGKKLFKIDINAKKKSYGVKTNEVDFKAANINVSSVGSEFNVIAANAMAERVKIKHIGLHNIYNVLSSIAACVACGIDFKRVVEALNGCTQAPGRLERVNTKNLGFEIVVDYAHTDDALKNVLSALNDLKPKRIITLFGCGGDRDRTKRPLMGKIAVEMSDFVFVTSDNPRTEDPLQIILDIEVGIKRIGKTNYKIIADREHAIKEAVMMAKKGDIILLAGKGHETYQITGTQKIPFNDIEFAQKYLDLKEKQKASLKSWQTQQKEFDF
ncbi:MAG: UDP-N-acetylmuramoyl-L-alanyl-D-glutamate--2,6-diaminopimelate ligase [Endomicrobium sp.]|jgi:UDP-N-acetylmuramoyl-L-alanyl-D-glutamate--2,6-diaminopimelate ligase|nr:UDP-N-acetylmuramoyl-L-alanyl-D-glutamate--2,6-diaminopimelate ligase [Endomicrobium sp.]